MNNKLTIVCSTRFINNEFKEHVIKTSGLGLENIDFLIYENMHQYSLTELYNKGLDEAKNDIILFIHDDIIFETAYWGKKLLNHFKRNPEYGILGVAGTNNLVSGQWWALRESMHGIVNHTDGVKKWTSEFSHTQGNKIKEMVVLDGVMFAVDKTKIKHQFDTDFKGFHFYDLSFCFPNYLDNVKIGVFTDILITHKSVGAVNKSWGDSKLQFEEKYIENLPTKIGNKIDSNPLINILLRTSNREIGYNRMLNCIRNQTYKNYRLIVSIDNVDTYNYVKESGIPDEYIVIINEIKDTLVFNNKREIYNLYFNPMLEKVKDGWVWCVDDDDVLADNFVFKKIASNCIDTNSIYVYRMNLLNNIIPSHSWGKNLILGDIGTPNFVVYHKYAKMCKWDGYGYADGRYIQNVNKIVKNIKWINEIIYIAKEANHGKPE